MIDSPLAKIPCGENANGITNQIIMIPMKNKAISPRVGEIKVKTETINNIGIENRMSSKTKNSVKAMICKVDCPALIIEKFCLMLSVAREMESK